MADLHNIDDDITRITSVTSDNFIQPFHHNAIVTTLRDISAYLKTFTPSWKNDITLNINVPSLQPMITSIPTAPQYGILNSICAKLYLGKTPNRTGILYDFNVSLSLEIEKLDFTLSGLGFVMILSTANVENGKCYFRTTDEDWDILYVPPYYLEHVSVQVSFPGDVIPDLNTWYDGANSASGTNIDLGIPPNADLYLYIADSLGYGGGPNQLEVGPVPWKLRNLHLTGDIHFH